MKNKLIFLLICALLTACGASNPVISGGQIADLYDHHVKLSNSKSVFFELIKYEGQDVMNASALTAQKNSGSGFFMLPYAYSRPVSAKESTIEIKGHLVRAAPVLHLLTGDGSITGSVSVNFKPELAYRVFGYFKDDIKAVWVEEIRSGKRVSDVIEHKNNSKYPEQLIVFKNWLAKETAASVLLDKKHEMKHKRKTLLLQKFDDGLGCDSDQVDSSDFIELGDMFYKEKKYLPAMNCYQKSLQSNQQNETRFKRIGLMFELGQGVDKSITEARKWYKKAGLIQ